MSKCLNKTTASVKVYPEGLVAYWYGNEVIPMTKNGITYVSGWSVWDFIRNTNNINTRTYTSGNVISLECTEMVDVTQYTSMHVSGQIINDGFFRFAISDTKNITVSVVDSWKNVSLRTGDPRTKSVDISDVSGSHYLFIAFTNWTNKDVRIDALWLE